jgi:hypothetical protein
VTFVVSDCRWRPTRLKSIAIGSFLATVTPGFNAETRAAIASPPPKRAHDFREAVVAVRHGNRRLLQATAESHVDDAEHGGAIVADSEHRVDWLVKVAHSGQAVIRMRALTIHIAIARSVLDADQWSALRFLRRNAILESTS